MLAITPLLGIVTRSDECTVLRSTEGQADEEKQLEVTIITIRLGFSFADNTINPLLIKRCSVILKKGEETGERRV